MLGEDRDCGREDGEKRRQSQHCKEERGREIKSSQKGKWVEKEKGWETEPLKIARKVAWSPGAAVCPEANGLACAGVQ